MPTIYPFFSLFLFPVLLLFLDLGVLKFEQPVTKSEDEATLIIIREGSMKGGGKLSGFDLGDSTLYVQKNHTFTQIQVSPGDHTIFFHSIDGIHQYYSFSRSAHGNVLVVVDSTTNAKAHKQVFEVENEPMVIRPKKYFYAGEVQLEALPGETYYIVYKFGMGMPGYVVSSPTGVQKMRKAKLIRKVYAMSTPSLKDNFFRCRLMPLEGVLIKEKG